MAGLGILGLTLTPVYLVMAALAGVPGLGFRVKCVYLAIRLWLKRQAPMDLKSLLLLVVFPLDSTRYFEMDVLWRALVQGNSRSHLDVSSPRLLFTLYLMQDPDLHSELVNPDKADLAETEKLIRACGLMPRCKLHSCLISKVPFAPGSFDTITSMSVLEHIPEDRQAVQKMWELLKPGGRLLLTLPCAAEASEQYIDRNEYGVLSQGEDGHVFWQRFYDTELLRERIFSVTGEPRNSKIFGERSPGLFLRNATRKRTDRYYPFWREPYMVAREYCFFESVEQLPGEGVIALEFVKP